MTFQIFQQPADRLVDGQRVAGVIGLQTAVRVPRAGAARAMLNLNETNSSLDQ